MTVQDLQQIDELFEKRLEKRFGLFKLEIVDILDTKLQETETRIIGRIADAEVRLFNVINDAKVDKAEFRQLEKRVSKLEDIILD